MLTLFLYLAVVNGLPYTFLIVPLLLFASCPPTPVDATTILGSSSSEGGGQETCLVMMAKDKEKIAEW